MGLINPLPASPTLIDHSLNEHFVFIRSSVHSTSYMLNRIDSKLSLLDEHFFIDRFAPNQHSNKFSCVFIRISHKCSLPPTPQYSFVTV